MLIFSIGILIILGTAVVNNGGRVFLFRHIRKIFWSVIVIAFSMLLHTSIIQYQIWEKGELTEFLLPEHQSYYFYFYVLTRTFAPHLLSFVPSLVVIFTLSWINKRNEVRFFEPEEVYLAATAIFLMGYPGWLFYILFLLVVYLSWHFWERITGNSNSRLPLYGLWIPVGLVTYLIIQYWLVNTSIWLLLKI